MQVQKALRFIETNTDIIEDLIQDLLAEKMLEAVEAISLHFLEIGKNKKNDRIMAFSNMTLGEMAAQELQEAEMAKKAQQYLNDAYNIQTKNASALTVEELSRVCLSLSAVSRHMKNYSDAKRYLELARDKTTDKRMLLNFYQESAKNLSAEHLFNQALDSQKRAHEIAKQLFKEDEYEMQECMVNLADAYEKAGEKETAAKLFTEFFQSLDGRDELASTGTSINSRLSRKLSIKTKTSTSIAIRNKSFAGKDGAKNQKDAGAIQRVAVTLRARQEFNMAEKLMLQAIKVKKGILGTEVNADIAYMYSELAVTYENSEDLKNAISCIKKQIAIYEELKMTETFDFVVANIYFAQLQKENGQVGLGIANLERGIEIQEKILDKNNRDACYELILNLRTLATYYGMSNKVSKGITIAEKALQQQQDFFTGMFNTEVEETMQLLAELYTVNKQPLKALEIYVKLEEEIYDPMISKDIFRKMAPLHQQLENYEQAVTYLQKVLNVETDAQSKASLLTKIAGNYKKANKLELCVEAGQQAYDTLCNTVGKQDLQSCRALVNLGGIYMHFENNEKATEIFKQYLALFEATQEMKNDHNYAKLKEVVQGQLDSLEGGEEYYDEEAPEEKDKAKDQ